MAAVMRRDEAARGDVVEDLGGGVCGTCGEAGDRHGKEVVDVVAKEAGLGQGDVELGGEVAQGGGLVASAFDDEGDVHFFGVEVDHWRWLAGDESHLDADAAEEGDAHNVSEGEGFELFAGGRPGEVAVGENAVDVEGDGLEGGEDVWVEGHVVQVYCLRYLDNVGGSAEDLFGGVCVTTNGELEAEQQVRTAEAAHVKAMLDRDEAALRTLWSPEMVVNAPNNQVGDGPGTLQLMRIGVIRYQAYEQTIECVKVFGDTAIVMGQELVMPSGGPDEGKAVQRRFLNVWQRSVGGWQQIARQATVIAVA
jgi:ketosteroid isomerase-like protein